MNENGSISIKVSKAVHARLVKDKNHFKKTIGINFTFNSTVNEYHKILDGIKK